MHTAMLPVVARVGPLPWQEWLTPQSDGLYHSPASRGWGVLTTNYSIIGTNYAVTNSTSGALRFYRLRK